MKITKIKKFITLVSLLCLSGVAKAGILSIDYVADDYFEYTETYTYDTDVLTVSETEYQKISPVNFNTLHDIKFEAPNDPYWDMNENQNRPSEVIEGGIRRKTNRSTFSHNFLTPNSPFTSILQDLMPELVSEPQYSVFDSFFSFVSVVESDEITRNVIGGTPEELNSDSYEQFYIEYSWVFKNEADGNQYYYKFGSWLRMPTIFDTIESNSYTVDELTDFLLNQNVIFTRFNESLAIKEYSDEGTEKKVIGYAGYGTYSYQVPEPSSMLLLGFALLGFRRFIKK